MMVKCELCGHSRQREVRDGVAMAIQTHGVTSGHLLKCVQLGGGQIVESCELRARGGALLLATDRP